MFEVRTLSLQVKAVSSVVLQFSIGPVDFVSARSQKNAFFRDFLM
jgi:hypothetical protein